MRLNFYYSFIISRLLGSKGKKACNLSQTKAAMHEMLEPSGLDIAPRDKLVSEEQMMPVSATVNFSFSLSNKPRYLSTLVYQIIVQQNITSFQVIQSPQIWAIVFCVDQYQIYVKWC